MKNISLLERAESSSMRDVIRLIHLVAHQQVTVLITGESGTGKELVARAIHECATGSPPFVAVNLTELSATLLESELFGHTKHAFTGASRERKGLISSADGGMLFLDELGELPPEAQVKLLRVIQHGEVRKIGADHYEHVNVRFLGATHRQLAQEVRAGRFREDLYHRFNAIRIHLPPLREREEDLEGLVSELVVRHAQDLGISPVPHWKSEVIDKLRSYQWPGNVRQLEHILLHAMFRLSAEQESLLSPVHIVLPVEIPYGHAYASLGVISRIEEGRVFLLVVRNIRWDKYFLPGRHLSKDYGHETNFRSNLVQAMQQTFEWEEDENYTLDEERIRDVTFVEYSAQELNNKLYHFRLFPLQACGDFASFDRHIGVRTQHKWVSLDDVFSQPHSRGDREVSPTLGRLLRHMKIQDVETFCRCFPPSFAGHDSATSARAPSREDDGWSTIRRKLTIDIHEEPELCEPLDMIKYRYFRSLIEVCDNAYQASSRHQIGYHTLLKYMKQKHTLVLVLFQRIDTDASGEVMWLLVEEDGVWELPFSQWEVETQEDFSTSLLEKTARKAGIDTSWLSSHSQEVKKNQEEGPFWTFAWKDEDALFVVRELKKDSPKAGTLVSLSTIQSSPLWQERQVDPHTLRTLNSLQALLKDSEQAV